DVVDARGAAAEVLVLHADEPVAVDPAEQVVRGADLSEGVLEMARRVPGHALAAIPEAERGAVFDEKPREVDEASRQGRAGEVRIAVERGGTSGAVRHEEVEGLAPERREVRPR